MTVRPVRLQLSRAKGFDLQALSRATNGLEAVNCARPTRWGNPWRPTDGYEHAGTVVPEISRQGAVQLFRERYAQLLAHDYPGRAHVRATLDECLRGRNLACWCARDAPCHADVLLELANT